MSASGNAALIPLFYIISPGEKPPLCWRSGRGWQHPPPMPLPALAHIPAPACAPAAPGPLLFSHPSRRRGRRQAFQSPFAPGARSPAQWLQWRPGLWAELPPLPAGDHLQSEYCRKRLHWRYTVLSRGQAAFPAVRQLARWIGSLILNRRENRPRSFLTAIAVTCPQPQGGTDTHSRLHWH